jgi:hypothetical protein
MKKLLILSLLVVSLASSPSWAEFKTVIVDGEPYNVSLENCSHNTGEDLDFCLITKVRKMLYKQEREHQKRCTTTIASSEIIYNKCIIDKMPVGAKSTLANSVRHECKRISCNPSWWESYWYE